MKPHLLLALVISSNASGQTLPVITSHPDNLLVASNGNGSFSVTATGATAYQWRFNGADLAGETNATLSVSGAQVTNRGYYVAIAKNESGWVPTLPAYLSLTSSIAGRVPLSNFGNSNAQAEYGATGWMCQPSGPITNGRARVVAGPALDQMVVHSISAPMVNGFFSFAPGVGVANVLPGDTVCYRVEITYTNCSGVNVQQSRPLELVAGGGSFPMPSSSNLFFPIFLEWPSDPSVHTQYPSNLAAATGETVRLTNSVFAYKYVFPAFQWRKDGKDLSGETNFSVTYEDFIVVIGESVLTLPNVQASDAGVYDLKAMGLNSYIVPKVRLSVQVADGWGRVVSPRKTGGNFVSDLRGVAGRRYVIQWSSNLVAWQDLLTLTNATGTATFTNTGGDRARFYRSRLEPLP